MNSLFCHKNIPFFLILIFTFGFHPLSAQVITYNKNFTFINDTYDEFGVGLVGIEDRQFIAGFVVTENENCSVIAEIDTNGNPVWTTIIGDSNNFFHVTDFISLNKRAEKHLALTGVYRNRLDSTYYYSRTFLIKMTIEGEIEWINIVDDSIFPRDRTFGTNVIETSDNGFAILGQFNGKGLMYKTDSLGNIQWHRKFDYCYGSWQEYMTTIEQTPDDGYLVGSYGFTGEHQSGDPLVYKLNSSGVTKWSRILGSPHPDDSPFPMLLNDSVVIAITPYTTKADWLGNVYEMKLNILKLRLDNGAVISDTMYGGKDKHYDIVNVTRLKDGDFVACGNGLRGLDEEVFLFGFNEDCDSLFLRYYTYKPDSTYQYLLALFSDCIGSSDGGILVTGYYSRHVVVYNDNWHAWLIKTDRYGCFEMGCDSNAIYILDQPDSITLCGDQQAEMSVTSMAGNKSFHWQVKLDSMWTDISDTNVYHGITTESLTIDLRKLNLPVYWYRCRVYNSFYDVYSDSVELVIRDTVTFIYQPVDQSVRKGDTAIFSISVTGEEPLSYQWFKYSNPVPGSINDTLIINNVTSSDTGIYFCRVINPCGPEESGFARLSVNYTSLDKHEDTNVIQCFPNPVDRILMLRIKSPGKKEVDIRLLDFSGKVVYSNKLWGKQEYLDKIDFSDKSEGVYLLEIRMGGEDYRRKIIK